MNAADANRLLGTAPGLQGDRGLALLLSCRIPSARPRTINLRLGATPQTPLRDASLGCPLNNEEILCARGWSMFSIWLTEGDRSDRGDFNLDISSREENQPCFYPSSSPFGPFGHRPLPFRNITGNISRLTTRPPDRDNTHLSKFLPLKMSRHTSYCEFPTGCHAASGTQSGTCGC